MSREVVVIGAGFGGLSTAILLARLGFRITLVEGEPKPGGCMRSYTREGVDCPVGVHYIGAAAPGEVLGDFLDVLGVRSALKLRRLGGSGIIDRYVFDDEIFDLPNTIEKLEASLGRRFADAPDAVAFVSAMFRAAMAGLRREAPRSQPALPITKSAADFLADKNLPERLVDILAVPGLLLGTNLADCPASFLSVVTASLLMSAWELGCTGSDMAEALADGARQAGVKVIVGDPVVGVDVDGGGACGVRLQSGAALPADTVVAAIHPKALAKLLPTAALPASYREGLGRLEETGGSLGVVALVDEKYHPAADHNVFRLRGKPRQKLEGVYAQLRPSGRPGYARLLILRESAYADWTEWHGTHTGRRGPAYRAKKSQQAQLALAEVAEAIGAIHGAQIIDTWTPLTLRDWVGAPQGGTYGVRHTLRDGLDFLVLSRPPLGRLFMVGQSAIAPGLLGISMGVLRVVGSLAGREALGELMARHRASLPMGAE
jgi:phytoene dehydrogenase-like protein